MDDNKSKIEELRERVRVSAAAYYEGLPIITDSEFDSLIKELTMLDPCAPELATIGYGYFSTDCWKPFERKGKYKHKVFVGSLQKIHSLQGFSSILFTPKLDGITLVCYYNVNGYLEAAVTRGNGEYGIDIKHKLNGIVPQQSGSNYILHGELLVTKENFKQLSQYSNPRSAITGIVFEKELTSKEKYLTFVLFKCYNEHKEEISLFNEHTEICYIVPTEQIVHCSDYPDLVGTLKRWKDSLPYPTDGIVLLHYPSNGAPERVAFKFETSSAIGEIDHIEWNMSGKKAYVPVVVLKAPIELYGSKVQRVTANNYQNVVNLQLGKGAVVEVTKANEIIPKIISVKTPSKEATFPSVCERCSSPLKVSGVKLICNNPKCKDVLQAFIKQHFCLDGMSDKLISKFLEVTGFTTLSQLSSFIYNMSTEDCWKPLYSVKGLGAAKIKLLKESISERELDLGKLLLSLSLDNVGEVASSNSKILLQALKDNGEEDNYIIKNMRFIKGLTAPGYKSIIENLPLIKEALSSFEWEDSI